MKTKALGLYCIEIDRSLLIQDHQTHKSDARLIYHKAKGRKTMGVDNSGGVAQVVPVLFNRSTRPLHTPMIPTTCTGGLCNNWQHCTM